MNYYRITLSQDYNYLINHIISTTLVEKAENNKSEFSLKTYQSSQREMIIITNKEIEEKFYEINYNRFILKWVVKKENIVLPQKKIGDEVQLEGLLSWSFVPWGTNKSVSPIDYKSNKVIHEDKLINFLSKNTGLTNITYSILALPKVILPDNKVIIYNRFKIVIKGEVKNADLFSLVNQSNIGKMKTYGHGALLLIEDSI